MHLEVLATVAQMAFEDVLLQQLLCGTERGQWAAQDAKSNDAHQRLWTKKTVLPHLWLHSRHKLFNQIQINPHAAVLIYINLYIIVLIRELSNLTSLDEDENEMENSSEILGLVQQLFNYLELIFFQDLMRLQKDSNLYKDKYIQ